MYDKALTVYTHTSNQYSVFSTQVISCGPREALYVLDGLLDNDTNLQSREHYTDTHGFTEQLFGLCFLLGFSFMPRLKDLADQQLYKISKTEDYGELGVAIAMEKFPTMLRKTCFKLTFATTPFQVS
jgi:TnpA family transposase